MITNLIFQKKSKKRPNQGDVFSFQVRDGEYFFGKVICDSAPDELVRPELESFRACLVAVYKETSTNKYEVPVLKEFLVVPQLINTQGWLRGFFETVSSQSVTDDDYERCSIWFHWVTRKYYRVNWRTLEWEIIEEPGSKPDAYFGLGNHLTIENTVCEVLGIPIPGEVQMGVWGTGLYCDDTSLDVASDIKTSLSNGLDITSATVWLLEKWKDSLDDPDEGPPFWFALAHAQLRYNALQEGVGKKALEMIPVDLERWSGAQRKSRMSVLSRLRSRIRNSLYDIGCNSDYTLT